MASANDNEPWGLTDDEIVLQGVIEYIGAEIEKDLAKALARMPQRYNEFGRALVTKTVESTVTRLTEGY
jgi:hypothetical protein